MQHEVLLEEPDLPWRPQDCQPRELLREHLGTGVEHVASQPLITITASQSSTSSLGWLLGLSWHRPIGLEPAHPAGRQSAAPSCRLAPHQTQAAPAAIHPDTLNSHLTLQKSGQALPSACGSADASYRQSSFPSPGRSCWEQSSDSPGPAAATAAASPPQALLLPEPGPLQGVCNPDLHPFLTPCPPCACPAHSLLATQQGAETSARPPQPSTDRGYPWSGGTWERATGSLWLAN